ncbi:odorant binding protein [Diachasma alloeum]|uniref:Odorant binding protein n=1 Tax=Diachasma alloeum TaxID=454923 RepID=A0A4E0RNP3_9HYME|nr:odorant binding protein [Diachasma alloeum]
MDRVSSEIYHKFFKHS